MSVKFYLFSLIASIFLGLSFCYAQTDNSSSKPVQFEDSKLEWKEFSSVPGKFSALFPKPAVLSVKPVKLSPKVEINLYIYSLTSSAEYSVMYADYPIPTDNPTVAKNILDFGAEGAVASLQSELLEKKEITLDGNPGRYLKEKLKSGEILRVKMILVGQRLYQVAITTPSETGAAEESIKLYQKTADKFLDSFKLIK